MLCEYRCGQEAKYQFKNGKWCCSKSVTQCPSHQKKKSIQMKKIWEDPNSKYNSISFKEKQSKKMKEAWKDPDSKYNSDLFKENQSNIIKELHKDPNSKYNSILCKEKKSNSMKEIWNDPNSKYNSKSYRKSLSDGVKEVWKDPNSVFNSISHREKISNIMKDLWKDLDNKNNLMLGREKIKITIEKIQIKYPTFYKEEKIRYNPDKPNEKEIQVHCKNHDCKNSKEKGGWFTPTGIQLHERLRCTKNKFKNNNAFFYCSQECKNNCDEFNRKISPLELKKIMRYNSLVYRYTNRTIKQYDIKDIELRGKKYGFDLDHKYSIHDGFLNNINPKIIGHCLNLHVIPSTENRKKHSNSSISIEVLLENINNFNEKETRKELI